MAKTAQQAGENKKHLLKLPPSLTQAGSYVQSFRLWAALLILASLTACGLPGAVTAVPANPPSAAISSPVDNQQANQGDELQVKSVSVDDQGIVRVELVVDGQVVWVDANAQPQPNTPFIVQQPWVASDPGPHTIFVRAFNPDNQAGQSEPVTVQVLSPGVEGENATPTPPKPDTSSNSETGTILLLTSTATPISLPSTSPFRPPTISRRHRLSHRSDSYAYGQALAQFNTNSGKISANRI